MHMFRNVHLFLHESEEAEDFYLAPSGSHSAFWQSTRALFVPVSVGDFTETTLSNVIVSPKYLYNFDLYLTTVSLSLPASDYLLSNVRCQF